MPDTKGLDQYERKRNFRRTPEPTSRLSGQSRARKSSSPTTERPNDPPPALTFVVQKHRASRLHYDFRLELDGDLKSWAVPKGPSADPSDRRLAVRVEDHPLEYASFEGVIPEREYGAGEVIVWDRGVYAPLENDEKVTEKRRAAQILRTGLDAGKISFVLEGKKLRGAWTLVRTNDEKDEWLLLKHDDRAVPSASDLSGEERSVLSGRTLEEVRQSLVRPGAMLPPLPEATGAWPDLSPEPMLATLAERPFSEPGWLFEPKLDGIRAIVFAGGGRVEIFSRRGHEIHLRFPGLTARLARDYLQPVVLDGEIVALGENGAPSFERLQQRLNLTLPAAIAQAELDVPAFYYVFDLLWAEGRDLRELPLKERQKMLRQRLKTTPLVREVVSIAEDGERAFGAAVQFGYEGVVAKRADSRYESGRRSPTWLKVKASQSDDFVIGGYTQGLGRRSGTFGALLLGQFDSEGNLVYTGRVGTGFGDTGLAEILGRLEALRQPDCPFGGEKATRKEGRWGRHWPVGTLNETVTWVRPELVAEVRYMQRTRDGLLRAPSFLRLRDDKPAEEARPAAVLSSRTGPTRQTGPTEPAETAGLLRTLAEAGEKLQLEVDGHTVSLTNLNKPLWPAHAKLPPVSKRDLIAYLLRVSPHLLRHVRGRPITLTRYPNGVGGNTFYQRHWERARPDFVETVKVYSGHSRGDVEYLLCSNLATLVWLGQVADLEIHTWFSRVDPWPDGADLPRTFHGSEEAVERSLLNYPDFIAFDLDPYTYSGKEEPGAEPELNRKAFAQVCRVARALKSMLDSLGLPAYLKTSGKTGLHIYVPILRHFTYEDTRAACETIGRYLLKAHPRDVTMSWATGQRAGRVFFDHNMNARSKTVASVYSPRAVHGAGVSTPLRWEELEEIWPLDFTLHTVSERLERLGDLWADILEQKHDLGALIRTTSEHPVP